MTGLQGERRIARTEPRLVEVVGLGRQSRPNLDERLRDLECRLRTGSWVQYEIPFQLQLAAFSFGVSSCYAETFVDWVFEVFDGERWHVLMWSADSPWPDRDVFRLPGAADFASNRFRIRLLESDEEGRCMHIHGLELFGTILPPWRLD